MIAEARGDLPGLEQVIYIGTADWDGLVEAGAAADPAILAEREASLAFDEPINIQYTSGTTGFPKGATLSHHNILNNGYFVGEGCGYTERRPGLRAGAVLSLLRHGDGNLGSTTHGACIVIPAPGFDPAATLAAVETERCTSLYGVPTMFIAELGLPDFASYDLSSLRTGIMAGSPCPVEVMKRVADRDAHDRGHDLLRDDGDVAGVDPDHRRRRHGAASRRPSAASIRMSRSRSSIPRPASCCPAAATASSARGATR